MPTTDEEAVEVNGGTGGGGAGGGGDVFATVELGGMPRKSYAHSGHAA